MHSDYGLHNSGDSCVRRLRLSVGYEYSGALSEYAFVCFLVCPSYGFLNDINVLFFDPSCCKPMGVEASSTQEFTWKFMNEQSTCTNVR